MAIVSPPKACRKRRRGRPTKLSPEVAATIIRALRKGVFFETAAQIAGIAPRTFFYWMSQGKRQPESRYGRFFAAVKKAIAVAESRLIKKIRRHGKKHWQALAWIAERRWPEHWGRARLHRTRSGDAHRRPRERLDDVIAEARRALAQDEHSSGKNPSRLNGENGRHQDRSR